MLKFLSLEVHGSYGTVGLFKNILNFKFIQGEVPPDLFQLINFYILNIYLIVIVNDSIKPMNVAKK
jgi:hypothetical protein